MRAIFATDWVKTYRGAPALSLDEFAVAAGELFVIVGPSGSGKSTLLRTIAGLTKPDGGRLELFGADASAKAPHERGVAMVFQGLALWPHLTVRGNLALGLDRAVPDRTARAARIDEAAQALGIGDLLKRRPHQLSGGERQRVAYARALVRRPKLLLLDEPFSDLDARLRRTAARLLRQLHDNHNMTTLLVTHDRTDAHLLADRIGVMARGRFLTSGRPDELHSHPTSAFAAEFLTDATVLPAEADGKTAQSVLGTLTLVADAHGPVLAAVRPDEITIGADGVPGTVSACEFAGGAWRCRIAMDAAGTGALEIAALHHEALPKGARVHVQPAATPRTLLTEDR